MPTAELTDEGRDPRVEQWLDDQAVPWRFELVPLDRIDKKAGLRNQARLEPLNDDVVERYTAAMARGERFPPVLLRDVGSRRKLQPLGGNHRIAAAGSANVEQLAAYVVQVADEVAPVLAYADNARHGLPPSKDERIQQAIHLIEAAGLSQEAAAAAVGLSGPVVSKARTVVKASSRARQLDVGPLFDALPMGQRERLATLRSDPVFAEATKLAKLAGMSVADVTRLVRDVKNARSDTAALTLIGGEVEARREDLQRTAARAGGRRKATDTAYTSLRRALVTLRLVDVHDVLRSVPSEQARRETRKTLVQAGEKVMELDRALARGGR